MILSRLDDSIKRHEGYRDEPYKDHLGNWTIGYGRLIHTVQLYSVDECDTVGELLDCISDRSKHEEWFERDRDAAIKESQAWLGLAWLSLSDARQEVVAEMCYQMGYHRLSTFVKFKAAIVSRHWVQAESEMLNSAWYRQTRSRATALADKFSDG